MMPALPVKELASQSVTKTVKSAINRVKHEIKDIKEPQVLQQEAGFIDFDQVWGVLEKNLTLLSQAQTEHETLQTFYDDQQQQMSNISDLMLDIQNLIV